MRLGLSVPGIHSEADCRWKAPWRSGRRDTSLGELIEAHRSCFAAEAPKDRPERQLQMEWELSLLGLRFKCLETCPGYDVWHVLGLELPDLWRGAARKLFQCCAELFRGSNKAAANSCCQGHPMYPCPKACCEHHGVGWTRPDSGQILTFLAMQSAPREVLAMGFGC